MPEPGLSARKIAQLKRFLDDTERMRRLRKRAVASGKWWRKSLFVTNMAGKERVMKIDSRQDVASANLRLLLDTHEKAVASGSIKPTKYVLDRTEYHYADQSVGVMEKVEGVGSFILIEAIRSRKAGAPLSEEIYGEALAFLSRHPRITEREITTMERQVEKNLLKISKNRNVFSVDPYGLDNIIIKGYDPQKKVFRIGLVDQVHPDDQKRMERLFRLRGILPRRRK